MTERPIFQTPEQAVTVTFHMVQRLAMVVSWCLVWLAHLTLAVLVAVLMWWFQVTPESVASAVLAWLDSKTALVLGAAGLSGGVLVTAYIGLVTWVRRTALASWLIRYMLQDA